MKDLVCTGQLSTAIWAHAHGCTWELATVWDAAFEWVENRVLVKKESVSKAFKYLDQLFEAGCPLQEAVYLAALAKRELSYALVEWLVEHDCPWNLETLYEVQADDIGDHSIAELFDTHFNRADGVSIWPSSCIERVVEHGCDYDFGHRRRVSTIRWLRDRGCPWPKDFLEVTMETGGLYIAYDLYVNQVDRPPLTASSFAIVVAHLIDTTLRETQAKCWGLLKSLIAAKCPMDETAYHAPIKFRELKLVRWLHEQGCPWSGDTFKRAVKSAHTKTVTYLLQQGCPTTVEEQQQQQDTAPHSSKDGDEDDEEMPQVICDTSITTASDWETGDQTAPVPDPDAPFEWKPARICGMR